MQPDTLPFCSLSRYSVDPHPLNCCDHCNVKYSDNPKLAQSPSTIPTLCPLATPIRQGSPTNQPGTIALAGKRRKNKRRVPPCDFFGNLSQNYFSIDRVSFVLLASLHKGHVTIWAVCGKAEHKIACPWKCSSSKKHVLPRYAKGGLMLA